MATGIYIVGIGALGVLIIVLIALSRRGRERAVAGHERDMAYARAVGYLIEGKKVGALKHLKEAVRLNPDNVHAYIKLGDLMREMGEVERALQLHRELTVRRGTDPSTERELQRSLTMDYLEAGRYSDARTAAEKLLGYDRKNEEALEIMARVLEEAGDLEKAYEVQEELVRRSKSDGAAFLALYRSQIGANQLAEGERGKAKKSFESALHTDGDCLPALLYLGDIHYEEGERKKAIERWVDLTSRFPQWAYIAYGRLEKAYYESGTFGEIERVYENVLRSRPGDVPTLLAAAEMTSKRGDFGEAMRMVKETLEIDPDCRRARQLLVRLRLEKGDTEAALKDVLSFLEESRPGDRDFICSDCGHRSREVLFRCPKCRKWNTYLT
jgi:lipopolysaccharide biosynthesis regulator YciM